MSIIGKRVVFKKPNEDEQKGIVVDKILLPASDNENTLSITGYLIAIIPGWRLLSIKADQLIEADTGGGKIWRTII